MSNGRLWLAFVGETMVPLRAPFCSRAWETSRFPSPLLANEPEAGP
jgi:hypothetical protein